MTTAATDEIKPKNPAKVQKAISIGKEMKTKDKEATKAAITREMWPLV